MANINELTITIELKKGILFKFLTNKVMQYIFVLLPRKWFWICINKSMLIKIGNDYQRFGLKTFGYQGL